MTSRGNVWASSHSITCGAISASANSRTALRNWSCSVVYSKSTLLLYDLFPGGVPTDCALLPVALDGHAAGDGDAEADLEGAVGGLGGVADAVEEVLHVRAAL